MKSIRLVKQHDVKDCGAASLCMISAFYGKKHSLRYMRELTHTDQSGVTIRGIVEGAQVIGIQAEAFEAELEELMECLKGAKPIMIHLKTNHFVIVYQTPKGRIAVVDPALGKYYIKKDKISDLWSGYMILFTDLGIELDQKESKSHIDLGFFCKAIRNNWKWLCLTSILSLFFLAFSVCSTYLFQLLMDHGYLQNVVKEHDARNPVIRFLNLFIDGDRDFTRLFAFMITLTILMTALEFFRGKISAIMSKKIDYELMNDFIEKIFSSKISEISTRMTGDYVARTMDLVSVRTVVSSLIVSFFIDINLFLIGSILLVRINCRLFFIALLTLLLYFLLAVLLRRPLELIYHSAMSANAEVQTCLKESLQGLELIKTYNIGNQLRMRLMEKHKRFLDKCYKREMLGSFGSSGSIFIEQVSNLIIIFIGFEFVSNGRLSLGELMTFFMMQAIMNDSAKELLYLQQSFRNGVVAADRLNDVVGMKDESKDGLPIGTIHEIRVEDLGFYYFGGPELFQHISFSIKDKKKLAIVGKNGCGKSTLLRLIMGTEEATNGHIFVNGTELSELSKVQLWDRIAYVPQNPLLFADTLEYNIAFGEKYPENEIKYVCDMAGLSEFIQRTPQGLSLFIDENAANLSAGQKQSLAIARALIRKPDILILDEATSNMDEMRERTVIQNLLQLEIPCVFVTHNSTIVQLMDEIVQVDKPF